MQSGFRSEIMRFVIALSEGFGRAEAMVIAVRHGPQIERQAS